MAHCTGQSSADMPALPFKVGSWAHALARFALIWFPPSHHSTCCLYLSALSSTHESVLLNDSRHLGRWAKALYVASHEVFVMAQETPGLDPVLSPGGPLIWWKSIVELWGISFLGSHLWVPHQGHWTSHGSWARIVPSIGPQHNPSEHDAKVIISLLDHMSSYHWPLPSCPCVC